MAAARELGSLGITVNVVYPPVTDTGWVTDEVRAAVESSTEHFHVALPEDVAEVITLLASDHARLITGSVVHMRWNRSTIEWRNETHEPPMGGSCVVVQAGKPCL